MPWKELSIMDQRLEFVLLAKEKGANISLLCKRFGISRPTAYKWLGRYLSEGFGGLENRSSRPIDSPRQSPAEIDALVLSIRNANNEAWGGRKIRRRLLDKLSRNELQLSDGLAIPSASTITEILRRHDMISSEASEQRKAPKRFERKNPNELWQMDFKGDVALTNGKRSHPFTILDDCSRFNICCQSGYRQTLDVVQGHLTQCFQVYGLPTTMLCDNGPPWGWPHAGLTRLAVWVTRLGIRMIHGRPYHPQTQGKLERFHRSLKAEVLTGRCYGESSDLQRSFDSWRVVYNHERPHEALDMDTPGSRYRVSERAFPAELPAVEYDDGEQVRTVRGNEGSIHIFSRHFHVGKALRGERVALRPTKLDGVFWIWYGSFAIGEISVRDLAPGQRGLARIFRSARYARLAEYPCEELPIE